MNGKKEIFIGMQQDKAVYLLRLHGFNNTMNANNEECSIQIYRKDKHVIVLFIDMNTKEVFTISDGD